MTVTQEWTLGVIIAGGIGRRLGGQSGAPCDKGLLALDPARPGHSLIAGVAARLRPQCDGLVINANSGAAGYAALGYAVVSDTVAGRPGPLAGLLAGMDYAAAHGFDHVLTAAADTPFLPADLGQRLCAALAGGAAGKSPARIALAASAGGQGSEWGAVQPQPVFGLWPVDLRADLRVALAAGVSKITAWAGCHGVALAVYQPEPGAADPFFADPFFNVNTAEDLALARAIWSRGPQTPGC